MELGRGARWEEAVKLCVSHECYLGVIYAEKKKHVGSKTLLFTHSITMGVVNL